MIKCMYDRDTVQIMDKNGLLLQKKVLREKLFPPETFCRKGSFRHPFSARTKFSAEREFPVYTLVTGLTLELVYWEFRLEIMLLNHCLQTTYLILYFIFVKGAAHGK